MLLLLLLAIPAILKALKDGLAFRPSYSRLAQAFPRYFGPQNWHWPYIDGDPDKGYAYSQVGLAWRTPFKSGWHLLDACQLLMYLFIALVYQYITPPFYKLYPLPSYLYPVFYWVWHQLVFTAFWKTPLTERKP